MDEAAIKEKYTQLQMLDKHIKQSQAHLEMLESQIIEINSIIIAIDEMKLVLKGTVLKVPIATGIFIEAKLENNEQFIVNVGANIAVQKDAEQTKALLMTQIQEITQVQQQSMDELQELVTSARELQDQINNLVNA